MCGLQIMNLNSQKIFSLRILTFLHAEPEDNVLVSHRDAVSQCYFFEEIIYLLTIDQFLCCHYKLLVFLPFSGQKLINACIIK